MKTQEHYFHVLDAIRGMAALVVMLRHTGYFWGNWTIPQSYLAVDLFFVLSGVVVANAYASRLRGGMSTGRFALVRLIRLYPLYVLGSILGLLPVIAAVLGLLPASIQTPLPLVLLAAALMLPLVCEPNLFPLNSPSWSLFFELAANLAYAALMRHLSGGVLAAIMLACACGLALVLHADPGAGLHGGFSPDSMLVGLCRVGYGFFAGVLLLGQFNSRARARMDGGAVRAGLCATLLLAVLLARPSAALRPWFDFVAVTVAFPVLIYLAMACRLSGAAARACALLGALSYPLYVLHVPLGRLVNGVLVKLPMAPVPVPWAGLAFVAVLLPLCWLIDRRADAPLRRWLLRRSGAAQKKSP
ncbi:acyltransferase family protein [Massilia sp. CCM 8695]|uniref:Acyltransferase family protein n=1 Tax=Massilia frigida TaxID=2609281 RepID=A0ABX0NDM6_9BURK|nr:acyltransferase [Massilia frigida]NHZ80969.1 acyltransferase family protein [Massilia frigida]